MIYFILFIALFVGVYRFDFSSKFHQKKEAYYHFILLSFVLLSGLSYKVGSDINAYMAEFSIISFDSLEDVSLFSFANRQPLWLLFENICKSIIDDFAFMKIIISVFVCYSFFSFFKSNTIHLFSALLAYYVMMSFDINFNILRQSISMSLFLIAYNNLRKKKFIVTYLLIFVSVLFHNSAIVLLIVPLLSRLRISRFPLLYISVTLGLALFLVFFLSYSGLLQGLSVLIRSDSFNSFAEVYEGGDYGTSSVRIVSVVFYLVLLSIFYWGTVKFKFSNDLQWMFLFYALFFILSYGIPVIGRIKLYFVPFYIITVIDLLYVYISKNVFRLNKGILTLLLLFLFLAPSIRYFFIRNPRYNDLQIVQYYPYHSIIDKRVEPKREYLFPANY